MSTLVATSNQTTAAQTGNQRKLDVCANGVQWAMYPYFDSGAVQWAVKAFFSTDGGATWTAATNPDTWPAGTNAYTMTTSLFIDQDDFAHLVLKSPSNGFVYYYRGTPNAGRTSWTWSAANIIRNDNFGNFPDVIALRDPAGGGGWMAHIVFTLTTSSDNTTRHVPVTITSGAVITVGAETTIGGTYSQSNIPTYPAIDFQHTGDGKTPVANPALFSAWNAGISGAGRGLRFKKATYAAGAWTWQAEREIDNTIYTRDPSLGYWGVCCLFDGARVLIGGEVFDGTNARYILYERDLADTATTQRIFLSGALSANFCEYGSMTYDAAGNVYLVGSNFGAANTRIVYHKYNRAANAVTRSYTADAAGANAAYLSSKRGAANGFIEYVFMDGGAVRWGAFSALSAEITTGTDGAQTAFSNQRKIDRTSNGVLWMVYEPFGTTAAAGYCAFSTDNGATWTFGTDIPNGSGNSTATYGRSLSLFIDQDDYAHVVFIDNFDGQIYYRRGTPNAGRTAYTWSAAVLYWAGTGMNYPDVVALRDPAGGGGWVVWVISSFVGGVNGQVDIGRLNITSGGVIGAFSRTGLSNVYNAAGSHQWPSIDFEHTGDGKTPVANPRLFAAWSAGKTGAGFGIRYNRATYSGGAWTWGAEVEVDNTVYWDAGHCGTGVFDGIEFVIGGNCTTGAATRTRIWQVTTASVVSTLYDVGTNATTGVYYSSITYDDKQNVYVVGADSGATHVNLVKYTRATTTVTATVRGSESGSPYFSMKRGYSGRKLEWVYMIQSASPYPLRYDAMAIPSSGQPIVMVV